MSRAFAEGRLVQLTHGDCLDGHSCAGLMMRADPGTVWVGIRPPETAKMLQIAADAWDEAGVKPPQRGRLLLTDISLQEADRAPGLAALRRLTIDASVVWLDHHEPQWPPELVQQVLEAGCLLRVDRTGQECGATMLLSALRGPLAIRLGVPGAAGEFNQGDEAAMRAVAHRDTWSDPDDGFGIRLGLGSARLRRDYVTLVQHGEYRAISILADAPMKRRKHDLADALKRIEVEDGVATIWGRAPLSDLAHRYFQVEAKPRLLLHFTQEGTLRVRSRPDTPLAAELARRHGGGGHAHAAGAPCLEGRRWRLRLYRLLRRRDPHVRKVVRDAHDVLAGRRPESPRARAEVSGTPVDASP